MILLCKATFALCAVAGAHADEVYKCPDGKGGVVYTEVKCKDGKRLSDAKGSFSVVPAPKLLPPTPRVEPTPTPISTRTRDAPRRTDPNAAMVENCNVDNPDYDPYFCSPGNLWSVYGQAYGPPYGPRPRPPSPRPPRPPHPPHKPEQPPEVVKPVPVQPRSFTRP
ncbi:DUF4124 domain-containing protein [Jeongeupia chitinilytica]|uniref:DUF4124 domain-containing protein n=1 Tax=Jeongeupia chitinilytica TaxID=1041641 RepID=UPI001E32E9BA|nr:DUF4124 domain-containing protein [Jeongeupia chitinilytica]